MLQYDFEESAGYWLTLATQALHRRLNDELGPAGITYRQSQAIAWLVREGPLTVSTLASLMMIERPTLVGILDRMERSGWIVREACSDDRRRRLICLTDQAEPVWEQIVECLHRIRQRYIAGLSPAEVTELKRLLRHINDNLNVPEELPTGRPRVDRDDDSGEIDARRVEGGESRD